MAATDSSSSPPLSLRYRLALAFLACLQNALVGGILYGWASIIPMLTADAQDGGAAMTLQETTRIFSWASCAGMVSTLLLGWLLDQYGPRICSAVSNICIAAGCLMFALSTEFESFAFATCLMAFGGPGIQVSIVHLANLFPENQFLTLSLLNGTISISFSVMVAFAFLWEFYPGADYQNLFGSYSLLIIGSAVASVAYWPDKPFESAPKEELLFAPTAEDSYIEAHQHTHLVEQPLDSYLRFSHQKMSRTMSMVVSEKAMESGNLSLVSLKDQPFLKQLTSATYLRVASYFIFSCFLVNFYVASIATELADFQDFTNQEQNELARIFTLVMAGGVVASFLVGWLMDRIGLEICAVLTLAFGMCHMVVLTYFADDRVYMILGFVVYVMFRQFLFPVYFASLTARLGFKYFGLLNGIGFAVSGVMQVFMATIVQIVQGTCHMLPTDDVSSDCDKGHWVQLHYFEFILLGILLLVPYFDQREKLRQDERIEEKRLVKQSWRNLKLQQLGSFSSAATPNNYGALPPTHEEAGLLENSESVIGIEL